MSFGLKNAGAIYQSMVTKMFAPQKGRNIEVYIDDILVKSHTMEQHEKDLAEAFQVIRNHEMKLNPAKFAFKVTSGKILGFIIHQLGIEANPRRFKPYWI